MKLLIAAMLAGFASIIAAGSASSIIVDLTAHGASGSIGDAFFQQIASNPTGTGYIDPFLRIQATGVERGVNSDGPYTMDERVGIWTHSILVNNFRHVDNGGVESIRFCLDINELNTGPFLGLDMLKVYVADASNYNTLDQLDADATLIYDMDAIEESAVHLDYSLNAGGGWGDMCAYLPAVLFNGHESRYLYVFSQFGGEGTPWDSDDGFEEWTTIDGIDPSSVQEGGSANSANVVRVIPNPSTSQILIRYESPRATEVTIEVFNAAGSRVRRLAERPRTAGQHVMQWDGRDDRGNALPSGVYLARVVTQRGTTSGRVVLAR